LVFGTLSVVIRQSDLRPPIYNVETKWHAGETVYDLEDSYNLSQG